MRSPTINPHPLRSSTLNLSNYSTLFKMSQVDPERAAKAARAKEKVIQDPPPPRVLPAHSPPVSSPTPRSFASSRLQSHNRQPGHSLLQPQLDPWTLDRSGCCLLHLGVLSHPHLLILLGRRWSPRSQSQMNQSLSVHLNQLLILHSQRSGRQQSG